MEWPRLTIAASVGVALQSGDEQITARRMVLHLSQIGATAVNRWPAHPPTGGRASCRGLKGSYAALRRPTRRPQGGRATRAVWAPSERGTGSLDPGPTRRVLLRLLTDDSVRRGQDNAAICVLHERFKLY